MLILTAGVIPSAVQVTVLLMDRSLRCQSHLVRTPPATAFVTALVRLIQTFRATILLTAAMVAVVTAAGAMVAAVTAAAVTAAGAMVAVVTAAAVMVAAVMVAAVETAVVAMAVMAIVF